VTRGVGTLLETGRAALASVSLSSASNRTATRKRLNVFLQLLDFLFLLPQQHEDILHLGIHTASGWTLHLSVALLNPTL
jgi:hypothetical protein